MGKKQNPLFLSGSNDAMMFFPFSRVPLYAFTGASCIITFAPCRFNSDSKYWAVFA